MRGCVVLDHVSHCRVGMNHATLKGLRFGIEIETVGANREKLANAIQAVVGGAVDPECTVRDRSGRLWRVVRDGSLSDGWNSGEIVSPVLTYDDLGTLQEVVRAVRRVGARADHSTGIHIHISGEGLDARAVTNMVKLVYKQERLIEKALGIREARLAQYCRPIDPEFVKRLEVAKPRTMQDLNRAWYGMELERPHRYDPSRYRGVNLNSLFFRGTVELRLFNGTLHAGEVKAYVQFALALAAKAIAAKTASSKRRDYNAETSKYDFRVVLLGLGLIGDEFKTARHHLTKRLGGSSAWKGERRDRQVRGAAAPQDDSAA